jgi:glyoxylase-like metal-dependent hydrolase (beta-lactamase superfamily II)
MPTSDHVSARQLGGATVAAISDGVGPWAPQLQAPEAEWRRAVPEAAPNGEFPLEWSVGFARVGEAIAVVDLGFDDPGPDSRWMPPRFDRSTGVEAGLQQLHVRPEDVTHVLITHPHGDHVAGAVTPRDGQAVARFPNARHVINRLDFEPSNAPLGFLNDLGLLDLVDGDQEVAPGLSYRHAPGESPGHSLVRVESDGQVAYFFGDLFHHPCEVANPGWVSPGRDREVSLATRRRFLAEAAAERAVCTFSHARLPAWGRIVAEGGDYRWEWL